MRVVSQNRDFSFNFDNTVFWKQYNIIYARIGKENIPIGQYESCLLYTSCLRFPMPQDAALLSFSHSFGATFTALRVVRLISKSSLSSGCKSSQTGIYSCVPMFSPIPQTKKPTGIFSTISKISVLSQSAEVDVYKRQT